MSMSIWLFMQSEIRLVLKSAESFQNYRRQGAGMSMHEKGSIVYKEEMNVLENKTEAAVYNNYRFGSRVRQTLAIDSKRAEILELLQSKNCIIVKGFSGCGKTTPQFPSSFWTIATKKQYSEFSYKNRYSFIAL